jgi:glycosyltransferase involved in cell wall biosynthesis
MEPIKISYCILTHNEGNYIQELISNLLSYIDPSDEIVVVDDFSDDENTIQILEDFVSAGNIKLYRRALCKDFASQKNFLLSKCTGDWIFNIDADELPKPELLVYLKEIIQLNPEVDAYRIPRENIVDGITPEHIASWGWKMDDNGFINFPDYQLRIHKRVPAIKWVGKVHETLQGYKVLSTIPDELALEHYKDIDRQEKQNNFYTSI